MRGYLSSQNEMCTEFVPTSVIYDVDFMELAMPKLNGCHPMSEFYIKLNLNDKIIYLPVVATLCESLAPSSKNVLLCRSL